MDETLRLKIAANESAFREVNEAIKSGRWPGEADARVAFRCECGTLGCNQMIDMTVAEYEAIRDHPRRFLIVAEHLADDAETIVAERDDYVVVEKLGEAGRLAEETDPRG